MRRLIRAAIVAGTAIAACKFTPGTPTQRPTDGTVADQPLDAPPQCMSTYVSCLDADRLVTCVAGSASTTTACGWGCIGSGSARCATVIPRGGAVTSDDTTGLAQLGNVTLGSNLIVNTDTGSIGTSGMTTSVRGSGAGSMAGIDFELAGSGSSVGVFRMRGLSIAGPLYFSGSNAVAFVVDGQVTIADVVDARGFCSLTNAGPGGFRGGGTKTSAAGSGGGRTAGANSEGGGGGGYGGNGGDGGNGGGSGGSAFGSADIPVLVGGGGGGGGSGGMGGDGGGGGGAIQIISNTAIAIMAGGINAGGCGGLSGPAGGDGGGGGGAGGTVLLEAPQIGLDAAIAVNGGGGGGGATGNMGAGGAGTLDRTPAFGYTGVGSPGGVGGAGSALDGATGSNQGGHGGGGGGGVGRIRLNTRDGSGVRLGSNAVLSPSLADSPTTCTQGSAATR